MRSFSIFVDILSVCYTVINLFNIKYEHSITLNKHLLQIVVNSLQIVVDSFAN